MIRKGVIIKWFDEKGFGFIQSDNGEDIFFHISELVTHSKRPQVGEKVSYLVETDNKGRLSAKNLMIKGYKATTHRTQRANNRIHTEPVKKDIFDYIAYAALLIALFGGGYIFYKNNVVSGLIPLAAIIISAIVILNRIKKPENDLFSCIKCKKTEKHSKRTIRAWNTGKIKLYCYDCHQAWLDKYGDNRNVGNIKTNNGCLSSLALFTLFSATLSYGFYWVVV